jgi:hypothetical protein
MTTTGPTRTVNVFEPVAVAERVAAPSPDLAPAW